MAGLGKYLILLLVVMLVIPTLLLVEPTKAQTEQVTTSCAIFVDNIVEGQPVTVTIQMSPATPTGEGYNQLFVWVTSPTGIPDRNLNGPWVKSNISTDPNGRATLTFDVPTYSGYWRVDVSFGSHYYANFSMLYLAGNWQAGFTVSPIKTLTPSIIATPTESPIPTTNTSPTVPEFPMTLSFVAVLVTVSLLLIIDKRKPLAINT